MNKKIQVLTRVLVDINIEQNIAIDLKDKINHLLNVLRLRKGDIISIFNEKNGEWLGEIIAIDKKQCLVSPIEQIKDINPINSNSISFNLAFSPFKSYQISFVVEKATEMGIQEITPIICDYTVVRPSTMKTTKIINSIVHAVEQCERLDIPKFNDICSFADFIALSNEDNQIVNIVCDPRVQNSFNPNELVKITQNHQIKKVNIILGPEGGFSEKERQLSQDNDKTYFLKMGSLILRTETAFIAAIASCKTSLSAW